MGDIVDHNPPRTRLGRILRACRSSARMWRLGYWQTWPIVSALPRWMQRPIQWACKTVSGHRMSDTEHGWDGGRWVDRWCRWCNALHRIPYEESTWVDRWADLMVKEFGDDL